MAHKYGVSKTPIRDALNALEKEGYLRTLPRKGYLVSPITRSYTREYFQVRLILEKAAASLATQNAYEKELDEIINLAKQFPTDAQECEISEFYRLNNIFHMSIVRASHNSIMVDMSAKVMENLSRVLMVDSNFLDFSNEQRDHYEIAQELKNRNSARAEKLIVEHISKLQTRFYSTHEEIQP